MSVESYVLDMMEGRHPGRFFLQLLSYLFRAGVALRNFGYETHLFKSVKCRVPVISVGNIVAGGTGKTPLVRLLVEALGSKVKTAILSRGYRSQIEHSGTVVKISPEERASRCGDEPLWLARKLPQTEVWVGKNRIESAERAVEGGVNLLVLDDGMQYRKLQRDWEVVVMDGDDLFGKGYFLPRGLLRDHPKRLSKADLIIVNGAKSPSKVRETVGRYTKAPLIFVQMHSPVNLQGKKVGVFCALGHPERFARTVRSCGGHVTSTFFKEDHEPFTLEEIEEFAGRSHAELLVCTEKDQVKFPPQFTCSLPILPLEGFVEIIEGREAWEKLVENIKDKVNYESAAANSTS